MWPDENLICHFVKWANWRYGNPVGFYTSVDYDGSGGLSMGEFTCHYVIRLMMSVFRSSKITKFKL